MLPAETRLLPLCLRYLQIRSLGLAPPPYAFPADESTANTEKSDPESIPILLKINSGIVSDNFYSLQAVFEPTVEVVPRGVIKVLFWRLEERPDGLVLRISKAITITNAATCDFPVVPLQHNAAVKEMFHRIRFEAVKKAARALPDVVPVHSDSDIEETVPEKPVVVTPIRRVPAKRAASPATRLLERSQAMEVDPQPDSAPVSTARKRRTPQATPTSPFRMKRAKFTEEDSMEKFPEYALEYLKFYYKA